MPEHLALSLSQISLGDPASVRPLPARPFLSHLFLENPMPLVGVCVAGAIVAFFVLNARGRAALAVIVGLVLATLAGGFYSIAAAVRTDHEALDEQSARLVDAAATLDFAALRDVLSPEARIESTIAQSEIPLAKGREAIVDAVRSTLGGTYSVKEHATLEVQATLDGPQVGRTQVRVRVTPSGGMYEVPMFSWWRIDWRRGGDGEWHAVVIEPLAIWWPGKQ